jgi:hypothetical protein
MYFVTPTLKFGCKQTTSFAYKRVLLKQFVGKSLLKRERRKILLLFYIYCTISGSDLVYDHDIVSLCHMVRHKIRSLLVHIGDLCMKTMLYQHGD